MTRLPQAVSLLYPPYFEVIQHPSWNKSGGGSPRVLQEVFLAATTSSSQLGIAADALALLLYGPDLVYAMTLAQLQTHGFTSGRR